MDEKRLTVMDGLQFGCGFFIAGFIFYVVMVAITFVTFTLIGGGLLELLLNL